MKRFPLLVNPPITTIASKADWDYESRFKLVFRVDEDNQDNNDNFAFFNNGELIINGENPLRQILTH